MTEPSDPLAWRHIAEVLAAMPDAYRRLLATHRPDDDRMCRACTNGGTGVHGRAWPCSIHQLAALAQELHERPLRGRPG